MAGSFANVKPATLETSPARVLYNGVDLGATLGNVLINWEYTKAEVKADQLGTTVIDRFNSGFNMTVETQIAQVRDFDTLVKVFPTVRDTTVTSDRVLDFLNQVCTRDTDNAAPLTLHRLCDADAVEDFDWVFFRAVPTEASTTTFGPEEQETFNIVWNIYPDFTEGTDRVRFFRIGKQSTVVP